MPQQPNPTPNQAALNALGIADSVLSRVTNTQTDVRVLVSDLATALAILAQSVLAATPASFFTEPGANSPPPTKSYATRTK